MARPRVGVPHALLTLAGQGGHGRVWHRTLGELATMIDVRALEQAKGWRARLRPLDVALANGHEDLPAFDGPMVVQAHEAGWFDEELRRTIDPEFLEFIEACTAVAVRTADRIITPSQSAARDMAEAYDVDPDRFSPVAHGVDPTFTPNATGGKELVAAARGQPESPYVLYAAALHPRKNLSVLREAVTRLADSGAPHVLVVAGGATTDRADGAELERAARADLPGHAGRVVRLKDPSDRHLAALLAGADAFCLPSLYEGFGMTALEAMACGTPVVVSDRGALPEVVGDAGMVVPPDADSVEAALGRILSDPALGAELGRKGVERARPYTWRRTAEGWLTALRRAAET